MVGRQLPAEPEPRGAENIYETIPSGGEASSESDDGEPASRVGRSNSLSLPALVHRSSEQLTDPPRATAAAAAAAAPLATSSPRLETRASLDTLTIRVSVPSSTSSGEFRRRNSLPARSALETQARLSGHLRPASSCLAVDEVRVQSPHATLVDLVPSGADSDGAEERAELVDRGPSAAKTTSPDVNDRADGAEARANPDSDAGSGEENSTVGDGAQDSTMEVVASAEDVGADGRAPDSYMEESECGDDSAAGSPLDQTLDVSAAELSSDPAPTLAELDGVLEEQERSEQDGGWSRSETDRPAQTNTDR